MSRSQNTESNSKDPTKGSPTPGEPLYIPVGKFGRPFSYHGLVTFYPDPDLQAGIQPGTQILVGNDRSRHLIKTVKPHGKGLLLGLEGSQNENDAARFTNKIAFLDFGDIPQMPEGKYFDHQLLGLEVVDASGSALGTLAEILKTGANDVYVVVGPTGAEMLLPAIPSVILDVDVKKGILQVQPPEWE